MPRPDTRRLSSADIERMNKSELKKALMDISNAPEQDEPTVGGKLDQILREVRELRMLRENDREHISKLERRIDLMEETCAQQQRFLEQIENEKRQNNVIITGVPEGQEPLEGAEDDKSKLQKILGKIGHDHVVPVSATRLGKPQNRNGRARPVLATLSSKAERDKIVQDAKKLKQAGDQYKSVFIKKDVHPSVRKELDRLRYVERQERAKPVNNGKQVRFDPVKRQVLVGDTVVDQFHCNFFGDR